MSKFTRWVLTHKLVIVLFWSIATAIGLTFVSRGVGALSQRASISGEAVTTDHTIENIYSNGNNYPAIAGLTLPPGTTVDSPGVRSQLGATLARVSAGQPQTRRPPWPMLSGSRVVSYASTGNRTFVSHDGRTTFALIYLEDDNQDALVRMLLVPALVALIGPWNWWLHTPAARLLRVPVR